MSSTLTLYMSLYTNPEGITGLIVDTCHQSPDLLLHTKPTLCVLVTSRHSRPCQTWINFLPAALLHTNMALYHWVDTWSWPPALLLNTKPQVTSMYIRTSDTCVCAGFVNPNQFSHAGVRLIFGGWRRVFVCHAVNC